MPRCTAYTTTVWELQNSYARIVAACHPDGNSVAHDLTLKPDEIRLLLAR